MRLVTSPSVLGESAKNSNVLGIQIPKRENRKKKCHNEGIQGISLSGVFNVNVGIGARFGRCRVPSIQTKVSLA